VRVVEPRGHRSLIERLWRAAAEGRLPHALSFEGPEGIGKHTAATWFAAGLLCAKGPGAPCGTCGPCKRFTSGGDQGNHPDLLRIDAVGEGEEQIRVYRIAARSDVPSGKDPEPCLETFLDLCAMEGRGRVVLIREAHRMNASAQNALLKTLEEPRPGTLLVLETHRGELLLPTIRSRCVRVRLQPLAIDDCREVLAEAGLEGERARRLARWSGGSPGRALRLAVQGAEPARAILEDVLHGRTTPLPAAARVGEIEGDFPGEKARARARSRARLFLDLVIGVLSDLQRLLAGLDPGELAHGDLAEELAREGRWEERDLARRLEALVEIRADVERNLGPEMLVERALLVSGQGLPILGPAAARPRA